MSKNRNLYQPRAQNRTLFPGGPGAVILGWQAHLDPVNGALYLPLSVWAHGRMDEFVVLPPPVLLPHSY